MKYLLSALLLLMLFSCNKTEKKEPPFDSFVYSYSAMDADYSIKFTNNDTVFFQKRYPNPLTNYYAVITEEEQNKILRLTADLDFEKYDSVYIDSTLKDGEQFKFYKQKKAVTQSVYVADMDGPEDLFKLATRFNDFTKTLNFQPYTGKVHFGNLKHIELPAPPSIDTTITN